MAKQWTEDLSVGVKEIDDQHKEFIKNLNKLLDAMTQGKGREEVGNIISFLEIYIDKHFELEQEYMRRYMYPDYEKHKGLHAEFMTEVARLKREFNKGSGITMVLQTERDLIQWFFRHIKETDKALGKFLKPRLK
jgi:hemerythrin